MSVFNVCVCVCVHHTHIFTMFVCVCLHKPRVGFDIDLVQCFSLLILEVRVGFGIGFDRLVQFACGLDNIRKSLFVCV